MAELKPWQKRPFELIIHAETHFRKKTDYDRRLALISFDNSIEVSIVTYLLLNPIQRGERHYPRADIEKWKKNFPSKIEFFLEEVNKRKLPIHSEKAEILWYHDQRNEHYHGGGSGVPEEETLTKIREISLWVFSVLFEISDISNHLKNVVDEREGKVSKIPDGYATPEPSKSPPPIPVHHGTTQEKSLALVSLIGQWDESNEHDMEFIKGISDEF
ncbi:hypothetical protein [Microbulbifer agarilyticus]|uniref:hypothetical protein n=1 Tax=Microbulbifer agarilyticus TaxID=260552 RepID=UPI001CD634E7|nr:hypothetical protein [Microbulbifer agarilyticus]MCA0899303.1 hypothetical protein [Microbulbifer agarilyticus]